MTFYIPELHCYSHILHIQHNNTTIRCEMLVSPTLGHVAVTYNNGGVSQKTRFNQFHSV